MGILQATSTQNDYVVSFWLVCFVSYIMLLAAKERTNWAFLLGVGCSLGLAIFTKATAYIFAFPFLVWFVLSRLKVLKWQSWKPILIVAVISLSINIGHYGRNFDLYSHPLGPGHVDPTGSAKSLYANETFAFPSAISNILRNISLHIGTPSYKVNVLLERGINSIHDLLNVDINDPRTTMTGREFHIYRVSNIEDYAGNPIHLALIVISFIIFAMSKRLRKSRSLVIYSLSITASFLLFCLYLKWQPYHSRLLLPVFILWAPFIAILFSSTLNHKIINLIALILILSASLWVFYNHSRPIVGNSSILNRIFFTKDDIFCTSRIDQYFTRRPAVRKPYMGAAHFLKSQGACSHIGLILRHTDFEIIDDWEYPFWVLLQGKENEGIRLEHVNVKNASAKKSKMHPFNVFTPCAIISLDSVQGAEIVTKVLGIFLFTTILRATD
jgi:hypothetical protein